MNSSRIILASLTVVFTFVMITSLEVEAHEIRPALLKITETEPGWFEVTWKVPMRGPRRLPITFHLPEVLQAVGPVSSRMIPGAAVEHSSYHSDGTPLVGKTIVIEGLEALQIDVLVQISLADGSQHSAILRPKSPEYTIPARATKWEVSWSYWKMGTIHILEGIDHLLFVLALMLIVKGYGNLLKTITAFTVAHSLTLGLATLGVVHIPSGPTEAVIALSILFLAVEIVHIQEGHTGLTERYPWAVAFTFGLFHGLGFAGALSEVGLPKHEIPLALFMFNLGVEFGQILFLCIVLGIMVTWRRMPMRWPQESWRLLPYSIGSIAAFWTIQRIESFL